MKVADEKDLELRQKYDKSHNKAGHVSFRLNVQERSVLEKMMQDEDWANVSRYIKHKLFDGKEKLRYKQMKRSADRQNIEIIMSKLLEDLALSFGYVNYRFNYELEKLNETKVRDERYLKKLVAIMGDWREDVLSRTDAIYKDCEEILKYLAIEVEKKEIDQMRFVPDYIIDEASKNWNDTTSPEAREAARRVVEEFEKKYGRKLM